MKGDPQPSGGDIIFILDASGSMSQMGREPVDCLNDFIQDQKTNDGSTFTLVTFNDTMKTIIDGKPLSSDFVFLYDLYKPRGMTALYDALGKVITTKLESNRNQNVILVILTDGAENASKEYTKSHIKRMTDVAKSKHNWQIVYLGANHNASAAGNDIGCTVSEAYAYDSQGMKEIVSNCCIAISRSKKTGSKINFS